MSNTHTLKELIGETILAVTSDGGIVSLVCLSGKIIEVADVEVTVVLGQPTMPSPSVDQLMATSMASCQLVVKQLGEVVQAVAANVKDHLK